MDSRAGGGEAPSSGEVGPVIGVLAVIAVLGILAGVVGRLCGGRTIMGYGPRIHAEAWLESNFSACLNGHPSPPPRCLPHPHLNTFPPAAAWRPSTASISRHPDPSQQKNYATAFHHSDSQLSSSSNHPFDPHHHHTDSSTPSSPSQLHFHPRN